MSQEKAHFWKALLEISTDPEERIRLWNGYLKWKLPSRVLDTARSRSGWPDPQIGPPPGGWPELSPEDTRRLDRLAEDNGGHPDFSDSYYMDFSDLDFRYETTLKGLTLVGCSFSNAVFEKGIQTDNATRFFESCWFVNTSFLGDVHFSETVCCGPLSFPGARFEGFAVFVSVQFQGGACFTDSLFTRSTRFDDSQFEERYFSEGFTVSPLADFRRAVFKSDTSFENVVFGKDREAYNLQTWPSRRADFSNARFEAQTVFRRSSFAGAPAFFEATLHEDTDFGHVKWRNPSTRDVDVDYAVRAWERLELIMSKLEKPRDRHRFFRLKMDAERRRSGRLMKGLSWLFEKSSDYGWEVKSACKYWALHWLTIGVVLAVNAGCLQETDPRSETLLAALAVSFSNAHAFLFLTAEGGYLSACRKLIEANDAWHLVPLIGTVQAILGPILLFLVLLTIRNRFRLA